MKVFTASLLLSSWYSRWPMTFCRAGSTAALSFSIAGLLSSQSYRDAAIVSLSHSSGRLGPPSIGQGTWPGLCGRLATAWHSLAEVWPRHETIGHAHRA